MAEILIDEEFRALLAPLSAEQYEGLEADILAKGCLDAIKLWNGTIIDGHNRYSICTKHDLLFRTEELAFDTRDDVIEWMIRNQLNRRNQTPEQISYFRGKLYEQRKKAQGGTGANQYEQSAKNLHSAKTADVIGQEYGVTGTTIRNDADFAKAVDTIGNEAGQEVKQQILAGDLPITKKDVVTLAKMKPEERKDTITKLASGEAKSVEEVKTQAKKQERKQKIEAQKAAIDAGTVELPQGVFEVIAIDPPWNYGREYDPDGSRVANPYPEMTQAELMALDMPLADNSVMFLWATHAFLWDAKQLLDHWGLNYKATLVWDKQHLGMGTWLRMQCEFCLVGVKGKPFWNNTTWRDLISEPRREHSRKPEQFYKLVEDITAGRRLEYFSRQRREGWEVVGDEFKF